MEVTCYCLNTKIKIKNCKKIAISDINYNLSPQEKSHTFFDKNGEYTKASEENVDVANTFPDLLKNQFVGSWIIAQCLMCKLYIYGKSYKDEHSIYFSELQEIPTDMHSYGRDIGLNYSVIYKICLPIWLNNIDISEIPDEGIAYSDSLKKVDDLAANFIQPAMSKLRSKSIRQKRALEIESAIKKIQAEQAFLRSVILNNKHEPPDSVQTLTPEETSDSTNEMFHSCVSRDSETSETLHNDSEWGKRSQSCENFSVSYNVSNDTNTAVNDIQGSFDRLGISNRSRTDHFSEGVFEMDGVFLTPPQSTASHHNNNDNCNNNSGNADLTDSEDEDVPDLSSRSNFEARYHRPLDFARSLPINIPVWPSSMDSEKDPKEPHEIGDAMIKLARSVRLSSIDAFGDLPPKF